MCQPVAASSYQGYSANTASIAQALEGGSLPPKFGWWCFQHWWRWLSTVAGRGIAALRIRLPGAWRDRLLSTIHAVRSEGSAKVAWMHLSASTDAAWTSRLLISLLQQLTEICRDHRRLRHISSPFDPALSTNARSTVRIWWTHWRRLLIVVARDAILVRPWCWWWFWQR